MIQKLGVTSIFVTHDQDEAIEVADEIIITNKGRIEQKGTPFEIYQKPETAFSATFFGKTSFLEDYTKFNTFERIEGAEKAIVRPEFVKIYKYGEKLKYKTSASIGKVVKTAFMGDRIEITVECNGSTLVATRGLDEPSVSVGEEVRVFLYKTIVTVVNKAHILDNLALTEVSMVI